jgi:HPt (histidine-containing phosphotransfer) domain-containing protein
VGEKLATEHFCIGKDCIAMPLDKLKALADFNITEQEYDGLLSEFVEQADQKIILIEKAIIADARSDAAELVHSLKGMAGNMRLDTCYDIARGIELDLKKCGKEYLDRRIADLMIAVNDVRSSIKYRPFLSPAADHSEK